MIMYTKFFGSRLNHKGLNQYLANCIGQIISLSAEDEGENNPPILNLLSVLDSGFLFIEDFIELPKGEEGDKKFMKIESILYNEITRFFDAYIDVITILIERHKNNKPYNLIGIKNGVWISYHD